MRQKGRDIFREFLATVSGRKIRTLGYLPRWIIFLIDVFIVSVASIVTFCIISALNVVFNDSLNTPLRYLAVILTNAAFFLIFRTYAGIIRHSTFIDGVKLLVSTTASFLFLFILNLLSPVLLGEKLFLNTGLFVNHIISFLLLFLFRILVKYIFERY